MKARTLLIGMILIAGVLLAGFGLDLARAQNQAVSAQVQPNRLPLRLPQAGVPTTARAKTLEYPVMNWERVSEYGLGHVNGFVGAMTALEVFSDALYAGDSCF